MSHTVTIQAELKDPAALEAACRRLNLPLPTRGKVQLFDRIAEGTGIQLDGWRFPICLTPQGEILFDNFGGFWGLPERLDELRQAYAIELARLEARRQGHHCREQALPDGSVRLTIQLEG